MRYKVIILFIFIWMMSLSVLANKQEALLIVDETNSITPASLFIRSLISSDESITIATQLPNDITMYDALVYIGGTNTILSDQAIETLNQSTIKKIFINKIDTRLTEMSSWQRDGDIEIDQTDTSYLSQTHYVPRLTVDDGHIVNYAHHLGEKIPIVVQKDNLLYLASIYDEDSWYDIQQFLQVESTSTPIWLTITTINYHTQATQLKALTQQLAKQQVNYTLVIEPKITDENNRVYELSKNKALLQVLLHLQQQQVPIIINSEVEQEVNDLLLDGITPSMLGYASSSYTTWQGQRVKILNINQQHQLFLQIPIEKESMTSDIMASTVAQRISRLNRIENIAWQLEYPIYYKKQQLLPYIKTFQHMQWLDMRAFQSEMHTTQFDIVQNNKEIKVTSQKSKLWLWLQRYKKQPGEFILWGMALFVALFIILFFINTLRLRVNLKKNLFNERKHHG